MLDEGLYRPPLDRLEELADPSHGVYPRSAAGNALTRMAERRPDCRAVAVAAVGNALAAYEENDITLNAFFVCDLMRLEAVEQAELIERAFAADRVDDEVLRPDRPTLVTNNRAFHRMLRDGVEVEYRRDDGTIAGDRVHLIDYDEPDNNDWLVVNQFTVIEGQHNRRPDVVVFVNGMPLGVIELKNAADEDATIWTAYNQLQTYKDQIPGLFVYNEALIVSDGLSARIGSLTAGKEWFKPWRTIEGDSDVASSILELEVLVRGVFDQRRLLRFLRHFIVFEHDTDSHRLIKIIAGYHQFHAVRQAIEATVEATSPSGDRRCGVVWHTQGSGKSLSMLFYAGEVVLHPAMENPTLVCLTGRNDLDDQLFGQFARCSEGRVFRRDAAELWARTVLNLCKGMVKLVDHAGTRNDRKDSFA